MRSCVGRSQVRVGSRCRLLGLGLLMGFADLGGDAEYHVGGLWVWWWSVVVTRDLRQGSKLMLVGCVEGLIERGLC